MRSLSARRFFSACVLPAATVAVLVVPGAASASLGKQCSGVNITGQGSSLQKLAQQTVWGPDFNTSTNKFACSGTQGTKAKPTVTYNSTGSGAGLKSWGVEGGAANYGATNSFVGTDEPPSAAQIAEIEKNETTLTPETVETIPVLQGAVAVIINLPAGCTKATSTSNKGRLVLNNSTLQGIFAGTISKWSQLKDGGDKLTCASKEAEESAITKVVRLDQSGTTHIFKRYLGLINAGTLETEKEASKTWDELAEGAESTTWPKAAGVVKPEKTGGGAVVAKVAETAGSIAYANLADARSNGKFSKPAEGGGPNTTRFWAPLQNKSEGTVTYTDPSLNKDVEALSNANCKETAYTNGPNPFPPPAVTAPWNEVTTQTTEKHYTLCGLTFDLGLTSFSAYPGTELGGATTAENYIRFVLDTTTTGGQKLIENHDYLALPKNAVLTEAQKGAEKIGF
jgi:ABC-type phosphate transport system substrate-binding protein